MMMKMNSKFECESVDANVDGETNWNNNGQLLLQDIQEISKALYLHNNAPSRPSFSSAHGRSKSAGKARLSKPQGTLTPGFLNEDLLTKDKKLSLGWNWKKSLKALTRIGDHKFKCCFNLHVHSIEGLPLSFDGVSLCVHWKRKSSDLQTLPSRVFQGVAEFDETLTHGCSIFVSRTVTGLSKYESKRFLLYASIVGAPEHVIGNHHVDVTRFLPLTVAELGGDRSSAKWSTSFRLAGKAVGASLNVSFSYQVMKDELMEVGSDSSSVVNLTNMKSGMPSSTGSVVDFDPSNRNLKLQQAGSFPYEPYDGLVPSYPSNDVILPCEDLMHSGSSLSKSISFLYQKLDEGNYHVSEWADSEPLKSHVVMKSESPEESNQYDPDDTEISIIEQRIERLEGDSLKLDQTENETDDFSAVEIINVDDIMKNEDIYDDMKTRCDSMDKICNIWVNTTVTEDSKLECSNSCLDIPCIKAADINPKTSEFLDLEQHLNVKSNYKTDRMEKMSHSLDDITESVANDFLNMLAMESGSFRSSCDGDPQSPREQLLREFEKEALASGDFTFDFDANEKELGTDMLQHSLGDCSFDSDLPLFIQAFEQEHASENRSLVQRRKAKILEDLETDSLMEQWGLNERDFQNSPGTCSGGFGSPIELSDEESSILPSIGQGFGSFVQITGGGFLRSMNPSLFRNAKNYGNLITQASNPVVLPAKMGNDILDILLHVASSGVEELRDQIYKLMPLQDITGKSIERIMCDAATNKGAPRRQGLLKPDLFEHIEAIAPMTVDKIESLLIDGLRMQSGMFHEEAPSHIRPQHAKMPSIGGRRANWKEFSASEREAKLQLEGGVEIDNNDYGLMNLSITLDKWLSLDSGIIEGDQNSEQNLNILKAHHSKIIDDEGLIEAMNQAKAYGRELRFMGDHLTVAFMIQLRNPLRNYEPVGVPMLVLTQVERVHTLAIQQGQSNFHGRLENMNIEDEAIPQLRFKINQIHLAGVLSKAGNKQVWGTAAQQQAGFRWLAASGLAGTVKHSSSKSKAIVISTPLFTKKLQNEDILWSLSFVNENNTGTNDKGFPAQNIHIRNPDIIFPN